MTKHKKSMKSHRKFNAVGKTAVIGFRNSKYSISKIVPRLVPVSKQDMNTPRQQRWLASTIKSMIKDIKDVKLAGSITYTAFKHGEKLNATS